MTQRPLIWAVGIAFAVGFGGLHFGTRLADSMTGEGSAPRAASVTPAPVQAQAGPAASPSSREVVLTADRAGHFFVHPEIDGVRARMLVDTGASVIALTAADAVNLGIHPAPGAFRVAMQTANGVVHAAHVRLREVRLGAISVRDVNAVVMPRGALSVSLLGTSFLSRLRGYEVRDGRMRLKG